MSTGRDKFKKGLEDLGYAVEMQDPDKLVISHKIAEGRFAEQAIKIGFQVAQDFEMTCPGGPHIFPRLIPINPQPQDHSRAADSVFGPEWEYLSRPFEQWPFKRTVKRYMEYIAYLLNTL